jgi:hypothetical protein
VRLWWLQHSSFLRVQNTGLVSESSVSVDCTWFVKPSFNKFLGMNRQKNPELYQCFPGRMVFEILGSDIEADSCVRYVWISTGELNIWFKISVRHTQSNSVITSRRELNILCRYKRVLL